MSHPTQPADEEIANAERALLAENSFSALHYTTETGAEGQAAGVIYFRQDPTDRFYIARLEATP